MAACSGAHELLSHPPEERVLEELHEGHPGISRMKSIARSFVWWPGLDKALDQKVKTCVACQSSRNLPPAVPGMA